MVSFLQLNQVTEVETGARNNCLIRTNYTANSSGQKTRNSLLKENGIIISLLEMSNNQAEILVKRFTHKYRKQNGQGPHFPSCMLHHTQDSSHPLPKTNSNFSVMSGLPTHSSRAQSFSSNVLSHPTDISVF